MQFCVNLLKAFTEASRVFTLDTIYGYVIYQNCG